MIRIGITGSIAMGKSTIANVFKYLGIQVHDSDLVVKSLIGNNIEVIAKIKETWPEVLDKKKLINKTKLRKIIFSNHKDKLKLEKILHPMVKKDRMEFEQKYNQHKILGFDIPLLYETKQEDEFDYIFLANCSKETQLKRAMNRKNLDLVMFDKINSSQFTIKKKISYNPTIINTEHPKIMVFLNVFALFVCSHLLLRCFLCDQIWRRNRIETSYKNHRQIRRT